jgi:RNA polymerase sigma factor (sigma-70 family)
MQTSSPAFLSMTTTMPSRNWCEIINRACEVCSGRWFAPMFRSPTTSRRKLFCALTRTSAAFGEARFSTWLYRIAYNCFREEARKRKELVGIDEAQLEAEHDPQTVDPALRHDLAHALQLLPLHERSAIMLCCQNGLSHDEASRVLDIPLGTVKTNVLRGREKLKRLLAPWGPN